MLTVQEEGVGLFEEEASESSARAKAPAIAFSVPPTHIDRRSYSSENFFRGRPVGWMALMVSTRGVVYGCWSCIPHWLYPRANEGHLFWFLRLGVDKVWILQETSRAIICNICKYFNRMIDPRLCYWSFRVQARCLTKLRSEDKAAQGDVRTDCTGRLIHSRDALREWGLLLAASEAVYLRLEYASIALFYKRNKHNPTCIKFLLTGIFETFVQAEV